ncbi:MsnO8 family LLM class oxidoreductase [Rubrobacter tropicus]|uniref:MsnO8 family LLM class oxidoreductase n=1 Tax=Rubrobacter tropicus TaxID=2653851 RepID=A0A6G8QCN3_9ACTN|nr:LLM class flavin-dependent oxidoreductase [Rubrobacter tropicus]QIN84246.1 MsnO8 family LLM class oxidoreductase [Rubrobacter tropicus]
MDLGLSVLDVSPVSAGSSSSRALRDTLDLARLVDGLGYRRYWLAEHHNLAMIASSAPEVMIGHVASVTENLRVGAGGIMLPNHAPLQVVETFRVLEALHPGRIDLGIGRAPGTDPTTAAALRRSQAGGDDFPQQFAELLAYAGDEFPEGHPFRSVAAMPDDVELPPIWLLGSSGYSARAAGEMGLGYAFAAHFSPTDPAPAMRAYNEGFEPSPTFERASAILAVAVVCAETGGRARELASSMELAWVRMRSGRPGPLPSPEEAVDYPYTPAERRLAETYSSMQIVGDPRSVRARIEELAGRTGADEIMVTTNVHDPSERLRSYELLAEAFEISPAGASSARQGS